MAGYVRVLESGSHLNPVRDAAREVGMGLTDGNDWNVLWSFRTAWDNRAFTSRTSDAKLLEDRATLVNHLPGTLKLASKAHLPAFARDAGLERATPTSFLLPEQLDACVAAVRAEGLLDVDGLPKWILKSKAHREVRALTSARNATRAGLAASGSAILQRRVRPLLLRGLGRAFDIGVYVVVASVVPLRVYAFDRSLVRVCERPFPTSAKAFAADRASFVIHHYSPVWTLPYFARSLAACGASAGCALRRELDRNGYNGSRVWGQMEGIAGRMLSALLPHVRTGLQRVKLRPQQTFEVREPRTQSRTRVCWIVGCCSAANGCS
jgi:hypothetical protein